MLLRRDLRLEYKIPCIQRRIKFAYLKKRPVPKNRQSLETNDLIQHILHAAFRYACVYHHLFDVRAALRLNRDVAVSAVEDAA